MNILVTGLGGFVGSWIKAQYNVVGLQLAGNNVDLRDKENLSRVLDSMRPDAVIHLAAQSHVQESFRDPESTYAINFNGTRNLLQALKGARFTGRFLYVSSADVYGVVEEGKLPVSEENLPRPRNPYAVSKVAAEALCYQWSQSEGMDCVIARPFNHIGPGQSPSFAVSDFARQFAEILAGHREPIITVGDLHVTRDFTDVRDVVAAYFLLLERGRCGEFYNICSATETSIQSILENLSALAGVEAEIRVDGQRKRQTQQTRVRGSYAKLERDTGWKPTIPLKQTLVDTLHYWERQLA